MPGKTKTVGVGMGRGKAKVVRRRPVGPHGGDTMAGITKPALRRLARRGGVKRIEGGVYEEMRGVLRQFLTPVLQDCVTYAEHARRKTITCMDVVHSLKRQGRTLYGIAP